VGFFALVRPIDIVDGVGGLTASGSGIAGRRHDEDAKWLVFDGEKSNNSQKVGRSVNIVAGRLYFGLTSVHDCAGRH
jgi:hypothetical protein